LEIGELHTRVGVADLMVTYQFLADSGKIRQLAELFASDGVLETDNGRFVGPEQIREFFAEVKDRFIAAGFAPARHHLSSVYVDARPDGHAATYACFQFVGSRGLDHWGTYRDEVAPVGDGWQFTHRRVTVEGCVTESPVRTMLGLTQS
jgi:hypothetical protein